MSDRQAALLGQIGDGQVVWISVDTPSTPPNFEGKAGWLRFMNLEGADNLIAGDKLPKPDVRVLMSGEWVDGNSTISAKLRGDGIELRTITEAAAAFDKAIPVLCHKVETLTRKLPNNPEAILKIAVYTGFRTPEDCKEGRLTTIAERFIGFSHGAAK